MKKKGNKGSALVLVLVSAIVLSILVGAVYTLFQANIQSQAWAKERIQARFTAEAGTNMAVHMIMEGADVPQGDDPIKFLPETGDWYDLGDEMGWVLVYVDPHDENDKVSNANAYEVRCLSKVISEDQVNMYGIASMILPRNFATYATFLNNSGGGYFGDGYRFDGPFHSNTVVQLSSATVGRDQDPWFYSLSVAADHYLYRIPNSGVTQWATEPHYANLFIEPYEKMLMGEPYFTLNADVIPFNSSVVGWQGAFNAANSGGLMLNGLQDGTRMILLNDTLLVLENAAAAVSKYCILDLAEPVVWVNNGNLETVYLKTEEEDPLRNHGLPDTLGLTIGVNGNLSVSGPILYKNIDLLDDDNKGMLGILVKNGNFTIAVDPDMSGGTDWVLPDTTDKRWDISTGTNDYTGGIEVDAIVMVLDGYFQLEDILWSHRAYWPHQAVDFEIVGGYIINEEYVTTWVSGTDTWGYLSFVTYDPRLMTMHPPYFPQTGVWDTAYWDERPQMTDVVDITDPNFIGFNGI